MLTFVLAGIVLWLVVSVVMSLAIGKSFAQQNRQPVCPARVESVRHVRPQAA